MDYISCFLLQVFIFSEWNSQLERRIIYNCTVLIVHIVRTSYAYAQFTYGHKCTYNNTTMHQNLWIVCMQPICVQGQPLRNNRWEVIKMRFIWWYSVSSNLRWIHLTSDYTILFFFLCTDWISLSRLFKLFANFILEVRACIPLFFLLLIVVIWSGFSFVKPLSLQPSNWNYKKNKWIENYVYMEWVRTALLINLTKIWIRFT